MRRVRRAADCWGCDVAGLLDTGTDQIAAPPDAVVGAGAAPPPDTGADTLIVPDTGAGTPPPDAGPSLGDLISGLVSKAGRALAGGPAGIATLTPDQADAAGRHAMLNFGLAMLRGGGPSYAPKNFGSVLAGGLGAAEDTEDAAETAAAVQRQAGAEFGLEQGKLGVQQGQLGVAQTESQIRLQTLRNQMQILQNAARAAGNMQTVLSGGKPPAGAPTPGQLPVDGSLPAPSGPAADFSTWKDPGAKDLVVAAANSQGLDPNLALAVAHQESQGNPAVSDGDGGKSKGLYQIGNTEAASVGVSGDDNGTLTGNVQAGTGYLEIADGKIRQRRCRIAGLQRRPGHCR